jgi:hypothetical protein
VLAIRELTGFFGQAHMVVQEANFQEVTFDFPRPYPIQGQVFTVDAYLARNSDATTGNWKDGAGGGVPMQGAIVLTIFRAD